MSARNVSCVVFLHGQGFAAREFTIHNQNIHFARTHARTYINLIFSYKFPLFSVR